MSTDSSAAEHPRVAIVTGGSGGIGRTTVERLAADGMSVVVSFGGNPGRAKEAVDAVMAAGGTATAIQADVADEDDVRALFDQTEQLYGGVDVVVNTAGLMHVKPLAELDLVSDIDAMIRTNIRGTFVVNKETAARIRGGGAIINFSSSVVKLAFPGYTGYAATKGAVDAITLILARELRGRDVTVNAVAPGPTATPLFLEGKSDEQIDEFRKLTPLERLGMPDDIAEVVSFLAGPARWVSGQILYANGGII